MRHLLLNADSEAMLPIHGVGFQIDDEGLQGVIKEAAKTGQPGQDQSFANDMNRGGDDADQPVQISSTKLNYHTYMNKPRSERWSKMETELFYQAVRQFGTDFAMIQQLLPNRTRHQIKLKFKNEERKHPLQIADAVVHRSKDHSQFELVIERLKAQEKESMNSVDTAADPAAESQATGAENEEEEGGKSGDKKEELEVDDWDQQVDDPEDQDVFDWSQYDIPDSSPTYGADKSQYNEMF
ncbi:unnamed protein product [Spirodela intermedia]|uniref:SANT domain-containing protein n=1 Tax=Spirodela intermedia TaxID=51605 RepID=A0A7I8IVJ9_SPIIN|nr:unnamed protein product [Spirodela intermedia]CAA6661168.1 unnamed protein product [Spirodela intermedia]